MNYNTTNNINTLKNKFHNLMRILVSPQYSVNLFYRGKINIGETNLEMNINTY